VQRKQRAIATHQIKHACFIWLSDPGSKAPAWPAKVAANTPNAPVLICGFGSNRQQIWVNRWLAAILNLQTPQFWDDLLKFFYTLYKRQNQSITTQIAPRLSMPASTEIGAVFVNDLILAATHRHFSFYCCHELLQKNMPNGGLKHLEIAPKEKAPVA
jgi:hypothetical protein